MKDPGGTILRTTRDAYGRTRKQEDPDRGTTILVHDGFGELRNSTDALGRTTTFEYDALGRPTLRTDKNGAELLTTSWTWDTAPNGIGKLHKLASTDGVKTYGYDTLGRLETLSLAITGESALLSAGLAYDPFGNVKTITYPAPNGAAPFVVAQDYDAHGLMLAAKEDATGFAHWRLTDVDNAGRVRKEVFGNDVSTERSYLADKQVLKSIVTRHGGTTIQKLGYDYDARLNLSSRTDSLQPINTTERFRYDALERVTCSYFSVNENGAAPCASSFDYAPNGNLTWVTKRARSTSKRGLSRSVSGASVQAASRNQSLAPWTRMIPGRKSTRISKRKQQRAQSMSSTMMVLVDTAARADLHLAQKRYRRPVFHYAIMRKTITRFILNSRASRGPGRRALVPILHEKSRVHMASFRNGLRILYPTIGKHHGIIPNPVSRSA